MTKPMNQVKGVGPATEKNLVDAGFTTIQSLAAATPEQLIAVQGFGEARAHQVIEHANQILEEVHASKPNVEPEVHQQQKKEPKNKKGKKSAGKKKAKPKKEKKEKPKKKDKKQESGKGKKKKSKKKASKKKKAST